MVSIICGDNYITSYIVGDSVLDIISSFTSFAGRMKPLPDWIHNGAILGLQGGTKIVAGILNKVKEVIGSWDDIAGVWLQDWTGQRNVTGTKDLPRTGLWWNWEVCHKSGRVYDKSVCPYLGVSILGMFITIIVLC